MLPRKHPMPLFVQSFFRPPAASTNLHSFSMTSCCSSSTSSSSAPRLALMHVLVPAWTSSVRALVDSRAPAVRSGTLRRRGCSEFVSTKTRVLVHQYFRAECWKVAGSRSPC